MSKFVKIPLIVLSALVGLVFALLVTVQLVLSEKTLTSLVNQYAVQLVDADVHFGRIKLSLVEKFPRASLTLNDVSVVTRPSASAPVVQGDTLASFRQLKVVMKVSDLWEKGSIHIPFVELRSPRIFARKYADGANWNILKEDSLTVQVSDSTLLAADSNLVEEDTSSFSLPVIHINHIRLTGNPYVRFSSEPDSLFAVIRAKQMVVRSNIRTDSLAQLRGRFTIDSLFVAGRYKKDTVFFGLENLELSRRPDTVHLQAKAKAALALASLGRTRVPMELDINIVKEDSAAYRLSLDHFTVSAFDVPVKASGEAWYRKGDVGVDVSLGTADEKRLYAYLKGEGSPVGLNSVADDMLFTVDALLTSDLKGLLELVPQSLPISASGVLDARISGEIKKSQLSLSEFPKANLQGRLMSKSLHVDMPEDTIFAQLNDLNIRLAAEGRKFRQNGKSRRMLTLSVQLDTAKVNYKNVFDVKGDKLALRLYNSASILTSPQKNAVHPFSGALDIANLRLKDSDGVVMVLKNSKESFSIRPKRHQPQTPVLSLRSSNGRFFYKSGADRFRLNNLSFNVSAEMNTVERAQRREAFLDSLSRRFPGVSRDSLLLTWRASRKVSAPQLPDFLSEKDFQKSDLHFSLPSAAEKYFREWNVNGALSLSRLSMVTPSFPLKSNVANLGASFNNNTISLDSLYLFSGKSDLFVNGKLSGLKRFLAGRGPVQLDVALQSEELDCNELLAAWNTGQNLSQEYKDSLSVLDDEAFDSQIEQLEVEEQDTTSNLFVVPANLIANVTVDAGEIHFGDLSLLSVNTELAVKERCVRITNTMATSDIGNVLFEGFYSTRTKSDLKVGVNLSLQEVTAEKVIELMPAIDTLMPLLSNFSGLLSCDLALTSQLDTNMNIVMPSAKGVVRIEGEDLQLVNTPQFTSLAKILMFKDKNVGYVDHLQVEANLSDGQLEIFPFVLKMDKYALAMSGIQNVDTQFRYHVSLIKSPLPFKLGIDLWGNFDDFKFSLCKPKYKTVDVPVFSKVVDDVRIDLSRSIGNIFKTGVDKAISANRSDQQFEAAKQAQGYVPAIQAPSDSLSASELEQIRKAQQ